MIQTIYVPSYANYLDCTVKLLQASIDYDEALRNLGEYIFEELERKDNVIDDINDLHREEWKNFAIGNLGLNEGDWNWGNNNVVDGESFWEQYSDLLKTSMTALRYSVGEKESCDVVEIECNV